MMKQMTRILTLGVAALVAGAATNAAAYGTTGRVLCDANRNQVVDSEDTPFTSVEVVVTPTAGVGEVRTDVTSADGTYVIWRLFPTSYESSLTPSTLPADAVILGDDPHAFTMGDANTLEEHDFLVASSVCAPPICGDGYLDEGEQCDDGNNVDGDGCSAICEDEKMEGCTPGYWRQEHHFDSYPAPYAPDTLFGDVFADAFPGLSLSVATRLKGGGLNALGRHAAAAVLNAASGDVDYGATTGEVIDAFNAAYASGDYEPTKDDFEALNTSGCPLN